MIFEKTIDAIGNTPLIRLKKIEEKYNLKSKIYGKIEGFNIGGSIKSRIAFFMIDEAIKEGKINKDTVVIEPTSGNTGISLAMICAYFNLTFIAVMPDNFSIERQKLIKLYGGKVILTSKEKGMEGSIKIIELLKKKYPNHYIPSQFENMNNPLVHYLTTGKEIIEDLPEITTFVGCYGTGGTLTGVAKRLKEYNKEVEVILVEPKESPLLQKGYACTHKIQGIGPNFIPKVLSLGNIDYIKNVSFDASKKMLFEVARTEGLLIGYSSSAALKAALEYALKHNNKVIVVLFPDFGERYLSTLEIGDEYK